MKLLAKVAVPPLPQTVTSSCVQSWSQANVGLTRTSAPTLVAHLLENLPPMQETWARSLGWKDPLEKGKYSPTPVFLSGEPHGPHSPWSRKELDTTEQLSLHFTSAPTGGVVLVEQVWMWGGPGTVFL